MTDRFTACLPATLREETGAEQRWGQPIVRSRWSYLDDPDDPGGPTAAGTLQARTGLRVTNRNSASSQTAVQYIQVGGWGTSTAVSPVTAAIDTASASELVISMQPGSAADTIALESYIVKLLPKS